MVKVAEDLQVLAFSEMKGMIKKSAFIVNQKLRLNMGKWGCTAVQMRQLRQAIFNHLSVAWRC